MADFLDYVRARKAKLKQELQELEAAERIYRESNSKQAVIDETRPGATAKQSATREARQQDFRPKTIKQQIRTVLEEIQPDGLSAQGILQAIRGRWIPGLERTSLSPQLSRLRKERVIFNRNGVWYLY